MESRSRNFTDFYEESKKTLSLHKVFPEKLFVNAEFLFND